LVNETFDYVKYLDLKKSIDDRSLNQAIWQDFSSWLISRDDQMATLKVLEIGAGIGTMIERLLDASLLRKCRYIALEPEVSFKEAAKNRLMTWAKIQDVNFEITSEGLWLVRDQELDLTIEWIEAEAANIEQLFIDESLDLLLSHAVIDLLPVPELMPGILKKLKKLGGIYSSVNFSGETRFYPSDLRDEDITNHYHRDMDARYPELDWQPSTTGVSLTKWLQNYGCKKVIEGDSDWELGSGDGLFIMNILDTIRKALKGFPELEDWLTKRYRQLEQDQLEVKISNRDCFGLK